MAVVAFVLAAGYQDSEFRRPFEALQEHGHQVTVVGKRAGERVEGKRGHDHANVEAAAAGVSADTFDGLVIPGGYSPDKLRTDESVVFVKAFFEAGKPVAAICHGPSLLVEADVLRGRTLTSWPSVRRDVENAGGRCVDREIVRDGNLTTSRKPDDLDAFCEAVVDGLGEPKPAGLARSRQGHDPGP
jgi:protease I